MTPVSLDPMDILSSVSGIITLLGAGGTIVQGLERLCSLREAPNTVLALNNEVSDFRFIILEILGLLQQESTRSSTSQAFSQSLDTVLQRAREKLLELECLIEYRLVTPNSGNGIQLNKVAWVLERHKVKRIQEEIRSLRINLITILSVLNCSSTSRLEVQLTDLRILGGGIQDRMGQALTKALTRTTSHLHAVERQLSQIQAQGDIESQLRDRIHAPIAQVKKISQREAPAPIRDDLVRDFYNAPGVSTLSISSTLQRRFLICTPTCRCCCHRPRSWRSPQWLHSLLRHLFTGYAGIPLISSSCDSVLCQSRSEPTATIQYYFPRWFAYQALYFHLQISKHNGIAQSLRMYRVVWNGSDILVKSSIRDLEGVKAILAARQGSPFDVSEGGRTALQVRNMTFTAQPLTTNFITIS